MIKWIMAKMGYHKIDMTPIDEDDYKVVVQYRRMFSEYRDVVTIADLKECYKEDALRKLDSRSSLWSSSIVAISEKYRQKYVDIENSRLRKLLNDRMHDMYMGDAMRTSARSEYETAISEEWKKQRKGAKP